MDVLFNPMEIQIDKIRPETDLSSNVKFNKIVFKLFYDTCDISD